MVKGAGRASEPRSTSLEPRSDGTHSYGLLLKDGERMVNDDLLVDGYLLVSADINQLPWVKPTTLIWKTLAILKGFSIRNGGSTHI